MRRLVTRIFEGKIISPWWIFVIDMLLVNSSLAMAYVLRVNINLELYSMWDFLRTVVWTSLTYAIFFLVFKTHRGVIRHTNLDELKNMFLASTTSLAVLLVAVTFWGPQEVLFGGTPRLVLIIHYLLVIFLSFGFRMLVKEAYNYFTSQKGNINTIIYGTGDLGLITMEAIKSNKNNEYNVIGFVDEDSGRHHVTLSSLPVVKWSDVISRKGRLSKVEVIILAVNEISVEKKQQIADACLQNKWKLKIMPTVSNWLNGISNTEQIRDVKIEDLLGREEIRLSQRNIMEGLTGKTILVTGAAGSIGSEIVRQLMKFPVKQLLLLDQAESALYDLQQEMLLSYSDAPFELILCSVTNKNRIRKVFENWDIDIVFNAAAYKHVPLMESAPYEAIYVNIGGTKNLADMAVEFGVEKFVMVSTDKAVNPTNVMGASKRVCEMYVQALSVQKGVKTQFITTRFGNVLGSNGSVIPLFKKQIAQGGPLTVTHKDITRFFMTIPEACQLLLEAAFMGNGGEIYVFDMGKPVKIDDLAKNMIRLAGLKLGEDIQIKYTGLRPGEKLYEELLASSENTLPTYHKKIMIGKIRPVEYNQVNKEILEMLSNLDIESDEILFARLKGMVPEFFCARLEELLETEPASIDQ
ncbi:FlaA1/EpsC-like NDP-sugar epimerase [Marinilabilia salmonicolor]|uniref:polysaccharide biosynthesis protein n=1 Tax=Marinilabilia salmonicolor TaxID=989 RepID=UPI000D4E5F1D|nr:nucleoside-diphosphate sugar epimerase/dehydratase [Marinilabilia salmonicolor]PRY97394.1 FlaA1/EpsC-like NDP-sugar epimerase [Marinilabilia salmonicolor]